MHFYRYVSFHQEDNNQTTHKTLAHLGSAPDLGLLQAKRGHAGAAHKRDRSDALARARESGFGSADSIVP